MKACPQCGKSFDDAFLVCPDDHAPLAGGAPEMTGPPADPSTAPLSNASIESALEPLADTADNADSEQLQPGTVLGSYRILDLLGEGGMGFVYRAEHTRLGRKVALKLLRAEFAANPKAASRFFSEAKAVNQIAHENIIQITDFNDQGAEKYYIMELLHGESLAMRMRRSAAVPIRQLLEICLQVCNALSAVHEAGMVHRDLKPDNIYLIEHAGRESFVKLLDFGVVKLGNLVEAAEHGTTAAGSILGTPEYMSPEQVSSNPIDHRTDIYALGVILYEGVTGRKPFAAKSFGEMVVNHLTVTPRKPTSLKDAPQEIPAKLETLLLQCLAKDRDNRPSTMTEIAQRLRAMLDELPVSGEPKRPRRSRAPMALAGVLALVAAVVGGSYVLHDRGSLPMFASQPPTTVEVAFDSTPPGAEVYVEGNEHPLGMTPFSTSLTRADTRSFRFELNGHEPATQAVPLRQNTRVAVVLAEVAPAPGLESTPAPPSPRRAKRTTKRPARRGTINPFD